MAPSRAGHWRSGPAKGRDPRDLGVRQALAAEGGQHWLRADLDETVDAAVSGGGDAVCVADGLANVADPVVGPGEVPVGRLSGDVRDERDLRGAIGEGACELAKGSEHRVHQRRVKRVGDVERPAANLALGESLGDRVELGLVTGENDLPGGVDGGDGDLVPELVSEVVLGSVDGEHPAAVPRQVLHQAGSAGDQLQPVVDGEDAGDACRDDLADAVTEDDGGLDAPAAEHLGERPLEREQSGLGVGGLLEQLPRLSVAEHHR